MRRVMYTVRACRDLGEAVKATVGFVFFLLFLAGLALVNLGKLRPSTDALRAPEADELTGNQWRLLALRDAAAAHAAGTSLQFTPGGLLVVDGACNRYSGDYRLDAGRLLVGPLAGTRRACAGERMAFDDALTAALADTDSVLTDGRQLVLSGAGERLARFAPAAPDGKVR